VFEYKVIPAPVRGRKARGARGADERFAVALTQSINAEARDGWEYLRSEMLPSEERSGLTRRTTVYHNLLVFRRQLADVAQARPDVAPELPPLVLGPDSSALPRLTMGEEGVAPRLGPAGRDLAAE